MPWPVVGTVAIVVLGLAFPVIYPVTLRFGPVVPRPIVLATYAWLGVGYYLILVLVAFDLFLFVSGLLGVEFPSDARLRAATAVGVGAAVAAVGFAQARRGPVVESIAIRIPGWPPALSGLRIVQITDVHIGSLPPPGYLARIVEQVRALQPDLVALTGDLIEERVSHFRHELAPLARLCPPLGGYFVTGNHDYYAGISAVIEEVAAAGFTVLRNQRVRISRGDAHFELAGVDDPTGVAYDGHGPAYAEALGNRSDQSPLILLAHDPRAVRESSRYGVALQLSGHTHGGQIWPGGYLVRPWVPYLRGLYRLDNGMQLYVSRGTGNLGLPMRFPGRTEITLIELQRDA
jgi:predicted MPP superfamily phosphohydrolase